MSTGGRPEVENPYAGQGPVLLDIGGEVGALVVRMPARMDGVEVEIRPAVEDDGPVSGHDHPHRDPHRPVVDHPHRHPHVAVVPRPTPAGAVHSLVYGAVAAGVYRLHTIPDGAPALEVSVAGGRVTQATWPGA